MKRLRMRTIQILLLAGILLSATFLFSVNPEDYEVEAKKTERQITIDGKLKEVAWKEAALVDNFTQREPHEGQPATERTELRILYDEQNLYFGLVCYDSEPGKIVANEMRRDAELRDDDYFEVLIDTFNDHRNAFYFAINPLGEQQDALIRDEGASVNKNWDGIWIARTQRTKRGWTAEIAIPFYTLRFKNEENQTWGINFGRHIARKREESYWTPILRDYGLFGRLKISYFGHLTGLVHLRQGKRLQLMPCVIGGWKKEEEGHPFRGTGAVGLDLKYRLTSNLTADVTLNTDFAQVEADQERFNLTRFDLFFPEKREFFLEGADIFRFGERYSEFDEHQGPSTLLFFSRTIGLSEDGYEIPVLGGLKITGKTGRYTLGILDILTDRLSYVEEDEPVDIQRTNYSIFRVKRDVFEKSGIGLIALSKDSLTNPSSSYNRAAGFDFNLAFGQSFQSVGFMAKTFSPGLRGNDWAGHVDLIWENDLWSSDISYTDIGENFNAEMGFIQRIDIRKFRWNAGVSPRPDVFGLRQVYFFNNFGYYANHAGELQSRNNMTGLWNLFQNGSNVFIGFSQDYEFVTENFEIIEDVFIPGGKYKFNSWMAFFRSDQSKNISLHAGADYGEFYNGRIFSLQSSGAFKLNKNFNLEFSYSRNQFRLPVEGGHFTINIASTRIICSFTPNLYAKAYVQWNDTEKRFKSNFLIRWIYKPGANIYFIYNETSILGSHGYVEDRILMLKVSFLFNF